MEVLERARTRVVGRFIVRQRVALLHRRTRLHHSGHPDSRGRGGQRARGSDRRGRDHPVADASRRAGGAGLSKLLGEHMALGMEIAIAIRNYDIPHEWPDDAPRGGNIAPTVLPEAATGRLDLRALPLVTIDGEDARDFDDAVYCEHNGKGFRLIVAIADVAQYVKKVELTSTARAMARGNLGVFPFCSNSDAALGAVERIVFRSNSARRPLCMVCEMHISPQGKSGIIIFTKAFSVRRRV